MRQCLALFLPCAGLLAPAVAHAQEPLRVAVFPSASSDSRQAETAAAFDSVVLESVGELHDVRVAARPALDLSAMELALGCAGGTRECLSSVLREAGAQALIASSVESDGGATLVKLMYFDARGDQPMRDVVRRYEGEDVVRRAREAAPAMLRELLQRPPRLAASELAEKAPVAPPAAVASGSAQREIALAPIALAGAGVVLIGVGAAFALAAQENEDAYRHADTGTIPAVDRARGKLETARDQTRLANIGFGVGAAAIAAGAAWLAIDLSSSPDRGEAVVSASAGPGELGLVLRGQLGGRTW